MTKIRSRSWLYEAPLFYLALTALQRGVFPGDPGFRSFNPNPMWLGVLLFGVRYGIGAGAASGAMSGLLLAAGAKLAGEGFRLQDADFWIMPGLFVVVGAGLGAAAERFAHRLSELRKRIDDLSDKNRGLVDQLQVQQKALRAVEQQVVSQMSSVVTLYHGSRELGTLDRGALMPAMLEFFTKALEAEKAALYVREGARWKLHDARGWSSPEEHPRELEPGRGAAGRAISERRIVTVKDALTEGGAVMAAPILDPSGEPAAVFAVYAMPFLRFNTAAVNLLALLAEWGGESLAKCFEVEALRARSILDERLAVHSARYLEARLEQEFARAKRFALPLSLVLVKAVPAERVPEERRAALLAAAAAALKKTAREIDIIARSPYDGSHLALLLPTTTREGAERAAARASQALAELHLPAEIGFGVASYKADMSRQEELVAEARQSLA